MNESTHAFSHPDEITRGADSFRETLQARWLAVVAHELRQPLSPIAIAASLLPESAGDPQKLARLQSMIDRQLEHLTRIISDLTDTARASTGKLTVERRAITCASFIDRAIEACRPALDARRQPVILRLPRRRFRLQADPGRLTQILGNLIGNASKFSGEGARIFVSFAVRDREAVLSVTDEGIGIDRMDLETLFDPVVQRARASQLRGAGLGLGLSIVRELAEAHGGSVQATSAGEGRGTCFVVRLPAAGPSDVDVSRSQRIRRDERAPRFYVVAHQCRENMVGRDRIVDAHA